MSNLGDFIKPDPDDPQNLAKRLNAEANPMNKGIAMLINAPSLVAGYSCAACGHAKDFAEPRRMTREEIRHCGCGACGSERVTLNLKGAM